MRFVLLLTTLAALGAAAPTTPLARDVAASEDEALAKRPNFKIAYHGAEDEALAKRPNFKIAYHGAEDEALAKRPNFKIAYHGAEDEAA
ncbi:hypothetical protein FQN49_007595 [Arthroderma sp. PD_2]|nr:hypothetical protein FQN49_007595 [Arthroderma sp. PD_2]